MEKTTKKDLKELDQLIVDFNSLYKLFKDDLKNNNIDNNKMIFNTHAMIYELNKNIYNLIKHKESYFYITIK